MLRTERKSRVRTRLRARSDRPRLSVFRSLKFIYAQIIDDQKGVTLAAARGKDPKDVGEKVAAAAKKKKIIKVVFDRGAYQYHGRLKILADAARSGGLEF
ncbi:50S ribosomal protein L18 [Candidatus Beckwithbacteria bacterium RIFCSPLOWO2_02_FULL_47_23]|nr:MAG: 50S ribosomal protein L18 [Candidatus Beckwithbacteria bacterium RIFCSPHIGHO2_12_FULL_47_17]OGD61854.1 MAG: 50S ribosomal protein L18 [Candidatus Beckwithbacteria bacterium RIFCSPLOWO2_02_FULL_47_23]